MTGAQTAAVTAIVGVSLVGALAVFGHMYLTYRPAPARGRRVLG